MTELALTTLKFVFLALLYLFIARAVRVIWLDLAGPRSAKPRPVTAKRPARVRPASKSSKKGAASSATVRSLLVTEGGSSSKTIPLRDQPVTLGRASECTLELKDDYVSQVHTRFFAKDGIWHVADAGSTNGTMLNRVRIQEPMPIQPGDEVRLGKAVVVEVQSR